jgi:hypothetical protein
VRDFATVPSIPAGECTPEVQTVNFADQMTWMAKNACPPNTPTCDATENSKQDNDNTVVECTNTPVDDYKCYQIKPANLRFRFESFRLAYLDQFSPFGPRDPLVVRPNELCTPVNKNAENPDAPESPNHLVCYKVADLRTRVPLLSVTDTDQFGREDLNVGNDAEVCLPAVKNCTGTGCTTQLAEVERELSHLACYQARSAGTPLVPPGQRTVSLEDQFGSTTGTIGPVNFHCNPMFSKTIDDGATEQLNVAKFGPPPPGAFWEEGDTIHYKCYGLTDNTRTSTTATILDQFESLAIRVGRATRLCEPAVKVLNTPLPPP